MSKVICLHCSGSSARQWASLAEALAPKFSVVAPDLIGYGAAAGIAVPRSLTLDDEAAHIEALHYDDRDDEVHLVGHSYGAAVALRMALRGPERVRSLTVFEPVLFGLLLDGDGAAASGAGAEILAAGNAICALAEDGDTLEAGRSFIDYWSGRGAWEALDARSQGAVRARIGKVAQEFRALFEDPVPLAAYRRLAMPVLYIEGARTLDVPREVARRLLPQLRRARYVRIAGAGHMGPITHARQVAQLIESHLVGVESPADARGKARALTAVAA